MWKIYEYIIIEILSQSLIKKKPILTGDHIKNDKNIIPQTIRYAIFLVNNFVYKNGWTTAK